MSKLKKKKSLQKSILTAMKRWYWHVMTGFTGRTGYSAPKEFSRSSRECRSVSSQMMAVLKRGKILYSCQLSVKCLHGQTEYCFQAQCSTGACPNNPSAHIIRVDSAVYRSTTTACNCPYFNEPHTIISSIVIHRNTRSIC